MSMWFYDDANEMEEYQSIKKQVRIVESEYLELRMVLRDAQKAHSSDPHSEQFQVKVKYLEKRIKNLEEKNPWLLWDTPIEVALFSPPHG